MRKAQQTWRKTRTPNTFATLPNTQKQTTRALNPQNAKRKKQMNTTQPTSTNQTSNKTPTQKTPVCKAQNQATIFLLLFLGKLKKSKTLAKTDRVHENAVSSPFQTQIVFCNFAKNEFVIFYIVDDHLKNLFLQFFGGGLFWFGLFSLSSFLANQHKTQQAQSADQSLKETLL